MRRDVLMLRAFYATPLGQATRTLVARKLVEAWGDAHGLDVLGVGYATPFLDPFRTRARRVVAAMPGSQGVEVWPAGEANLACLAGEQELPFPNAFFDRIVVAHGLEESEAAGALMQEVRRVLAPSGRVIVVAANRRGLWARAEETPFGHGRPFSREQLEEVVIHAGLAPEAWSRALYVPPLALLARHAELFEQFGSRLAAPMAGLLLLEAVKQTFAVKPRGAKAPATVRVLRPAPLGASRTPNPDIPRQDGLGGEGNLRHRIAGRRAEDNFP